MAPPRHKVLIVDDEVEVTYALQAYFQKKGYEMVMAFGGAQAIAQVEQGPVDLVLLDVMMPEVNGVEVLRHLRGRQPDTRVIVITAYDDEYRGVVEQIGVHAFLNKPFGIEQLTQTIEGVLAKPATQRVSPVHEAPAGVGQPSAMPRARLLMVEASEYVFNVKRVFFETPDRCGGRYEVAPAYSMIEALERLHTFQPDLVLVDLVAAGSLGDLATQILSPADHRPKELIVHGSGTV
ncbi:MAG: response regulator, partial [Candidatus Omnitrophica bacterium]|nr:response regulator [Candidatus Omnitrophota bacterium]